MNQVFHIKDFKGFEALSVPLKNLTILAGSNSVGKSSIIQALLLSRFTYETRGNYGSDVTALQIPLNGPFLLELGNTYEVIRRTKKIADSLINFSITEGDENIFSITLDGNRDTQNNYLLVTQKDSFSKSKKGILAEKFYYLCAERIGPRLNYTHEVMTYLHTGYRGERTFQILSSEKLFIDKRKSLGEVDVDANILDQTRKWLNYIIPGANFDDAVSLGKSKVIQGTFGESLPTNVGFGISYVLPIIVNGLLAEEDTVFIVENPEAHLHPSGQSRIGRFLSKVASCGVQVIVETHSEHVINGMRIALLEGDKLSVKDSIINFLSPNQEKQSTIKSIEFDDEAEFNQFPPGFIDQEQRDIAEMVRILRNREQKNES